MRGHNSILWIFQIGLGIFFISFGIVHYVVPEGLPAQLDWMYDLDDPFHYITGTAEILGGLGLILPGLTRIAPGLVPVAAVGLILVMVGAMVWHFGREEYLNIGINAVVGVALAYVAYGRWKLSPVQPRPGSTVEA
jgi:uncharacterized membrane protein YphA (DoxX/SURF4 family)